MSADSRRARVKALAKINLELTVLGARPDGYHELRTIFQTISLADDIEIAFAPARRTKVTVASDVEIAGGNIMERAAHLALDAMGKSGSIEMRLRKRIPMGAGLGGGSSDAAAVLLALPVLARKLVPAERLMELAACLGSDVPFFLWGGTALGLSRGTELYPLPDVPQKPAVIVAPRVHVSTREAYAELDRRRPLTSDVLQNKISSFQSRAWENASVFSRRSGNDFEAPIFALHPRLKAIKQQLMRLGADTAMLSGSGSAVYGIFRECGEAERAAQAFRKEQVFSVRLVSRARYRASWRRSLGSEIQERVWPPQKCE